MPRIYISYRPEDSSRNEVDLIRQRVAHEFGAENILESTGSNVEITTHLQQLVRSCDVMLVVIGRYWADMVDEDGNSLLHDPYDPIHVELDAGLKTLMVIKVIVVDAAPMPSAKNLPETLRPLLSKDLFDVQDDYKLNAVLDELLTEIAPIPSGTMAEEHGIDDEFIKANTPKPRIPIHVEPIIENSVEVAPPIEPESETITTNNSPTKEPLSPLNSFLVGVVFTVIFALLILIPVSTKIAYIDFEHEARFYGKLDILGFTMPEGFLYFGQSVKYRGQYGRSELVLYYVDPRFPNQVLSMDALPTTQADRTAVPDDAIIRLEEQLDDTVAHSFVDLDSNQAFLITPDTTLYILDLDTLELQSKHRLIRSAVRDLIPNKTIIYNEKSKLLMILLGKKEIRIWRLEDEPQYKGSQTVGTDSTYIFEFAIDRSGKFVSTRGDKGIDLYQIHD